LNKLDEFEEEISDINNDINDINEDISNINEDIDNINDDISDINTDLTNPTNQSNQNTLDIAQMKIDTNLNVKPSINANTTEINNIK
jgi:chromosome segregation ATPase